MVLGIGPNCGGVDGGDLFWKLGRPRSENSVVIDTHPTKIWAGRLLNMCLLVSCPSMLDPISTSDNIQMLAAARTPYSSDSTVNYNIHLISHMHQ
jgi:hypothetical protein